MKGKVINIIEDDPMIMSNLIRFINRQPDLITGITANSVEAYFEKWSQFQDSNYHILLLDIGLPGKSGLQALPEIRELQPELEIIMLTTYDEERIVLDAMCKGAVAYMTKETSMKEIVEAIRTVIKGGSYMSPMIARDIFNYMLNTRKPHKSKVLTTRQLEILEKVVEGKSYTVIGRELFISPDTVRSHLKAIYRALEVANRIGAVKKYLEGYR